jgi:hypothetical protein
MVATNCGEYEATLVLCKVDGQGQIAAQGSDVR